MIMLIKTNQYVSTLSHKKTYTKNTIENRRENSDASNHIFQFTSPVGCIFFVSLVTIFENSNHARTRGFSFCVFEYENQPVLSPDK